MVLTITMDNASPDERSWVRHIQPRVLSPRRDLPLIVASRAFGGCRIFSERRVGHDRRATAARFVCHRRIDAGRGELGTLATTDNDSHVAGNSVPDRLRGLSARKKSADDMQHGSERQRSGLIDLFAESARPISTRRLALQESSPGTVVAHYLQ